MIHLSISEISLKLLEAQNEFLRFARQLNDRDFFEQPEGKWSVAQHTRHLVTSANAARLAFILPKFILKWAGGISKRKSGGYDELVSKYKQKLQEGGRATGRYIPKAIAASYGKEKLLNEFETALTQFITSLEKNSSEQGLDKYIVSHPLLGKITLRELSYFTIYHTWHHLKSIGRSLPS